MPLTFTIVNQFSLKTPRVLFKLKQANRAAIARIGKEMNSDSLERFERQVDPEGRPWKRWSKSYAKRRGFSGKILQRSGRLKRSLGVKLVGEKSLVQGSIKNTPPYARRHQKGGGNVPQRAYVGFSKTLINKYRKMYAAEIKKAKVR